MPRVQTSALVLCAILAVSAGVVHATASSARLEELERIYGGFLDDLSLDEHDGVETSRGSEAIDAAKLNLSPETIKKIEMGNPTFSPQQTTEDTEDCSGHYGTVDQGQGVLSDKQLSVILRSAVKHFRESEDSWTPSLEYCENMVHKTEPETAEECKEQCVADRTKCTAWHFTEKSCYIGDPMRCASDMILPERLLRGYIPGIYVVDVAFCYLTGCPDYIGDEKLRVKVEKGERSMVAENFLHWAVGWIKAAKSQEGESITVPPTGLPSVAGMEGTTVDKFSWITSLIGGVMQLGSDRNIVSPAAGARIQKGFQRYASVANPVFSDLKYSPAQAVSVKRALDAGLDGSPIHPVLIDETTQRPLALQARTTIFDEDGGAMKEEFLSHLKGIPEDHLKGFLFRSAQVTLGDGDQVEPTIKVDTVEEDQRLIDARHSANAFGTDFVHPYEHFQGRFAQETWRRAAQLFRGLGYSTDENYELGVVYRTAKPPSKLSYTPEEYATLAGTVWHKDVYATANVIFYPFCFLEGYDTEIVTREMYEEIDPKSRFLGALPIEYVEFSDSVTLKSFGDPENGVPPTGAVIAFQNDYTRHAAHPPKSVTEAQKQKAIDDSIKYGGEGKRLPGDIVRVFLHFTLRKKSQFAPMSEMQMLSKSKVLTNTVKTIAPLMRHYYREWASPEAEIATYASAGGFAEKRESKAFSWAREHEAEYRRRAEEYAERHGRRVAVPKDVAIPEEAEEDGGALPEKDNGSDVNAVDADDVMSENEAVKEAAGIDGVAETPLPDDALDVTEA